jgi:hypothetical protein
MGKGSIVWQRRQDVGGMSQGEGEGESVAGCGGLGRRMEVEEWSKVLDSEATAALQRVHTLQ